MTNHICPTCGQTIGRRKPTETYTVRRAQWGNMPDVDFDVAEYKTPARAAGVGADVTVPLLQSAISGIIAGLLSGWLAFRFAWPVFTPFLICTIVFALTWIKLLSDHRRSLWNSERIENKTAPAAPEIDTHRVRLEIVEPNGHLKYVDLPIAIEDLRVMARAIVNGRAFSLSEWAGKGKLLSRNQFEVTRTWILNNDYGDWIDPENRRLGVEFNSKGQAFWRGLAEK
jgi:hypothetical protein